MKKICFLSCLSLDGHVTDENLAINELEKNNDYKVTTIPWENEADWKSFDAVIIRTTWNYHKNPVAFAAKLKLIAAQTKVLNPVKTVEWNFHKAYLKELESMGVEIVPTHLFKLPGTITPPSEWKYDQFIIKPAISASAYKTIIVSKEKLNDESIHANLHAGDWILQPFIEEIKQGEVSLHFFNKEFSHAIIKVPKAGDFRVQEEWGGNISSYMPDEKLLIKAQSLLNKIPSELLYARVDMVNIKGSYALMEVELIEPALYFRTSSQSVTRFKQALDKFFTDA